MSFKLASVRDKKPGYFGLSTVVVFFLVQNKQPSCDLSRIVTSPEVVFKGLNEDHSHFFPPADYFQVVCLFFL